MKITKGMKCHYKPFGEWEDGKVVAVLDDGRFMVSDGAINVAQYDDSLRYYSETDIGENVIIEPEEPQEGEEA